MQYANGSRVHGVVMLFMSLDILSIFTLTIFVVVHGFSSDDCPWADCFRNSPLMWEGVKPIHCLFCWLMIIMQHTASNGNILYVDHIGSLMVLLIHSMSPT